MKFGGDNPIILVPKIILTEYYEEGNNPVIQQGDIPIVGFSDNKPFNNFSNVILFGDHTLSLFKPETPFLLATDGIKNITLRFNYSAIFVYNVRKISA